MKTRIAVVCSLALVVLAACSAPATPDVGAIQTAAAQTVIAQIAAQPTQVAQPAPQSPQAKAKDAGTPGQPLPKGTFAPGQTQPAPPQAKGTLAPGQTQPAQPKGSPPAGQTPGAPPQGKAQPGAQGGPYLHHIESATSQDGLSWTKDERVLIEHASVPTAIVTPEGKVRLYYVDASKIPETTNCAESSDGGKTFTVLNCVIEKLSSEKALDPSIVRLSDGRYRLYYYGAAGNPDTQDTHYIVSAISTDGVRFTEEGRVFNYPGLVDPDVFWTGKEWLMYVHALQQGTIVARSKDGASFEYVGAFSPEGYGTTAPVKLDDGRFRLYAFNQRGQATFHSFTSTDALTWTPEAGERLKAKEGTEITDPFVVRLADGTWKMFYKVDPSPARK